MCWPSGTSAQFGIVWVSALCAPLVAGAAEAGVPVAASNVMVQAVSPLRIEVRHRFRRHRRPALEHPGHGAEKRGELEAPPPAKDAVGAPVVSRTSSGDPAKDRQPQAPEIKDQNGAKPPEGRSPPPPETWSTAEVQTGLSDCDRRLSGLRVLFDRLDPIKEGACGAPAPIRLKGFDNEKAPSLAFSPAPTISCKMTEALRRWFDDVVQPQAKSHLNATIVQIVNLSAYSCRTRYDDLTQRMSAHAYANAIDVGEFVTAKGEHVSVLNGWTSGDERSAFLHGVHDGACEIFGTTLGPEANEAHKNHFHLDMIERRHPLCDFTPAQIRARDEAKKHPVVPASAIAKVPAGGEGPNGRSKTLETQAASPAAQKPSADTKPGPKVAANDAPIEEPKHHRRWRHRHRFARFWNAFR